MPRKPMGAKTSQTNMNGRARIRPTVFRVMRLPTERDLEWPFILSTGRGDTRMSLREANDLVNMLQGLIAEFAGEVDTLREQLRAATIETKREAKAAEPPPKGASTFQWNLPHEPTKQRRRK